MRRYHKYYKPLALIMITIMLCSAMVLQFGISQAQADTGNLADKAVAFLKTDYETNGATRGMAGFGPFDAYVLNAAGVDVSAWQHNSAALPDTVKDLVQQDISNASVPVKYLAQDLAAMQKMNESSLANQLQTLITNRQNNDGSFQNDANIYSIIPAYELLGREGKLSIVDSVYAQNYILNAQNGTTGAWCDFMVTAQAVRALNYLSPGSDPNSPVGQAITGGSDWMKQQQSADGSFSAALDDPLIDTAEAIATQKALGLDPAASWTNNGKSAVDYLNNNALNADGSFGSSRNIMDATWALYSYKLLGILPTGSGGGGGGGGSSDVSVRVRVEGITGSPVDRTVSVAGTALDALNQAVGSGNVVAPGGFITSINGESGYAGVATNTDTSWFYYAIRNGTIDADSLSSTPGGYNIADGDQVVFYVGAYEAPPSYAAKTFLPVVSVSPQAPTAGQTVTLSISAKKYDWSTGLQDLTTTEATALGDYTVQAGGTTYTSSYGQVSIPNAAAGTLSYVVTNQSSDGYPDVVPYRGSINIAAGGGGGSGGSSLSCSPGIQVVGKNGEGLFGPANVTVVSSNTWGLTALGALDATGLTYTMSPTWVGFVDSIAGQAGTGSTGWMYTVNGSSPLVLAKDYPISDGDRIVWYFSNSMDQEAPVYGQPGSGGNAASNQQAATSTTGKATVYPAAGGKIGLGDEASIDIPPGALNGTERLDVSIQKVSSPPLAPKGFRLLDYAFEFAIGSGSSYKFNKPVTLTFSFDPTALPEGQKPSVYYYDAASSKWVDLGGTINGGTITVSVDHLTRFALIIKETDFPQANPQYFQFVDVPASFWASDAIMKINRLGYVNGYPDGTFKPDKQITRAEFVSILDKVLNLSSHSPAVPDFSDVASEDWFYHAVENAVHAGIIRGYGSIFGPDRQVTREEVAVILVNALGKQDEAKASTGEKTSFTDDASISYWARGSVVVAVKHGLIGGYPDGEFKAQGSATRAEACAVINSFLNLRI